MKKWRCALRPKCYVCPYEKFQALECCQLVLAASLQELRWSLPFGLGKYFKTHEHRIECTRWKDGF